MRADVRAQYAWVAAHLRIAEAGAAGPFYTRKPPTSAEVLRDLHDIVEGNRWLAQSEGDPAWRPSPSTPELTAQLEADDAAEERGVDADERRTCGVHRSWCADCVADPSHSNPVLNYNWCTTHVSPVQVCKCWPATVDGKAPTDP